MPDGSDPPILRFLTPGNAAALVAVSAAGLLNAMTAGDLGRATLALVCALGLGHVLLGLGGLSLVERHGTRLHLGLLFVALVAVDAAAIVLSHGTAWLMALSTVSQAVLYLKRWGAVAVVGTCAGVMLAMLLPGGAGALDAARALAGISAGMVFVVFFSRMALSQHRARREVERLAHELGDANQRLRAHAGEVEELATARERNRIAREIHDGLGHYLTVVHVQLEAAQATLASKPDAAQAALGRAQQFTHEGLEEVRRSVSVLRGSSLPRPLLESLGRLTDECAAGGLPASLEVAGSPRPLADPIEFTLYRTAQEALTNVRRHARASRVTVELSFAAPGVVRLAVADDGVGADDTGGGFGLVGLRERAELVGGTLALRSGGGRGFTLELEVPG